MEWIETTGKTVEEAQEAALDELGVDEEDAEFEVLAEPKSGLFGRLREEARVRARVRPTAPRQKEDRRDRRRRGAARTGGGAATPDPAVNVGEPQGHATATATIDEAAAPEPVAAVATPAETGRGSRSRRSGGEERTNGNSVDVPLEEQAEVAREFVSGLVAEFGLDAKTEATVDHDEDVINVEVGGDGLGLLIGPKGATLLALQDLTRSAVQQKTGAGNGRLNVDVSGYRAKRAEALARFAHQVAEQVKASGTRQALEPMSAADRKVIHDALTDVVGIATVSQGEDAARRVVIVPAGD
jgi:spoIIIJ-associated protein